MAEILQKVNRHEKSICGECSHRFVCRALDNQPCFECNQFEKEVVQCKDCKHWHEETGWCYHHSHFIGAEGEACHPWESNDWKMFDADYFCKDGERRTDEAT